MSDFQLEKLAKDPFLSGKRADGTAVKVMIVDDSMAIRRLLSKILKNTGYDVVAELDDGKKAIAQYSSVNPDVVTMDITMPELEGDEAVEHIKKIDPDARIVMVTSVGYKEKVAECLRKGAKGYILKPITAKQIPKILETIINATK